MRYAIHFVDPGDRWLDADRRLFAVLLGMPTKCHVTIRRGSLPIFRLANADGGLPAHATSMLDLNPFDLASAPYIDAIGQHDLYALLVQGLTRKQAELGHTALTRYHDYAGTVAVRLDDERHWLLYGATLLHGYRLVGSQLRVLHDATDVAGGDERDFEVFDHWRWSGLFNDVVWENIGLKGTMFDEFESSGHGTVLAEAEDLLDDLLEGVSRELMLRVGDLDPGLVEALHVALLALSTARTAEQYAQSGLSCRRFLERLADRLFPATDEKRNGRELGQDKWRNRLWAFAKDSLDSAEALDFQFRLDDLGKRIDHWTDASNQAVHRPAITQIGATTLVVGLVSLTYDLVLLVEPPTEPPTEGYEPHASTVFRKLLDGSG